MRRWLIDSWPDVAATNGREPSTVLPSDVVQYGPNALREAAVVKKLMHVLVEHGWLIPLESGTVIDGKARKSAFRIARAA